MNDEQIKHMVNRFLGWRLPANFSPDAGISFKAEFNEHTAHPMKHQPSGTNLFDAAQAEAMVRYMVEGMPRSHVTPEKIDKLAVDLATMGVHVPARDTAFFQAIVSRWLSVNG